MAPTTSTKRAWSLTSALIAAGAIETLVYTALTPLLPGLKSELGLSKAGIGLLVAAYPAGVALGAIPTGLLASRVGARAAAITSIVSLAVTAIAVGTLHDFVGLVATRGIQGVGAGVCAASCTAWLVDTAPLTQRARQVGLFNGAAALGSMLGPAIGGFGASAGRAAVFAAIGASAAALAALLVMFEGPAGTAPPRGEGTLRLHRSRAVLGGHCLVAVPGLLLGATGVLVPLELNSAGVGPPGIAATYLIAAAMGTISRPVIGRVADRRGVLRTFRFILFLGVLAIIPLTEFHGALAVASSGVIAISVFGALWAPAMTHLSREYTHIGVTQMLGFSLMNIPIGLGTVLGAGVVGELAKVTSDSSGYLFAAAVAAVTGLCTLRLTDRALPVSTTQSG